MSLGDFLAGFPTRQRSLLVAATEIYGDDVNDLLNALQETAARIAIFSGVTPEAFAAGVKHHWDHLAVIVNETAEPTQAP